MHVPFVLVFHQSKSISAIKRILIYYRHACILVFFHVFVCSLLMRCMLKSSSLRVGVKTLYNTPGCGETLLRKYRQCVLLVPTHPYVIMLYCS